jgi:hypothetical protein
MASFQEHRTILGVSIADLARKVHCSHVEMPVPVQHSRNLIRWWAPAMLQLRWFSDDGKRLPTPIVDWRRLGGHYGLFVGRARTLPCTSPRPRLGVAVEWCVAIFF